MEKKFALCATKKINILTLVFSENKILNETINHNPPPHNNIRDYMGVQSIFGLFLQLNWKETTFDTSWKIYVKTSFNIPLNSLHIMKSNFHFEIQNQITIVVPFPGLFIQWD